MVWLLPFNRAMRAGFRQKKTLYCLYRDCPSALTGSIPGHASSISRRIVRKGSYLRSSDSRRISRFYCQSCRRSFSSARQSPCFRQKKRKLNERVKVLLCSGVSQRRVARLLGVNRKTIVRKLIFLSEQAAQSHANFLTELERAGGRLKAIQFDEMESFERSKCLPLSIPLVVDAENQRILGFGVCSMPANGPLALVSRRKYGPRADDRKAEVSALFTRLASIVDPQAQFGTDQNPKYPSWMKPHFPAVKHRAFKGRRGCVVGQGELKRGGLDPLFALNHTAAMIRANVNRLFRRTWCTTKRKDRLAAHLAIYVEYHNTVLIPSRRNSR